MKPIKQFAFENPFDVTRAVDFTDEQILEYWVDLKDGNGFLDLIKPRLAMPMLILGSKGSGKTHIMRYLSFPLQKMRHSNSLSGGIRSEGWVGLYMRCSGLNSIRFDGKRQTDEVWAGVFAYYLELWLALLVVDTCCEIISDSPFNGKDENSILSEIKGLFDTPLEPFPTTLTDLSLHLRELTKELDAKINNCGLNRTLDITIRTGSGRLIFGIPQIFSKAAPDLQDTVFVYLIDEFENLTEPQQKLINTLIREKQNPCSFKIGSRLYGIRTYSTFCANEDNKEGSEYERLPLDARLREMEVDYARFARRLVIQRLEKKGILASPPTNNESIKKFLSKSFEFTSTENLADDATKFVQIKYADKEKPYFKTLRQALQLGVRSDAAPGVTNVSEIETILSNLQCEESPLLEKLNCFILYQKWSSGRDLSESSENIAQDCRTYIHSGDTSMQYHGKLLHWKSDLLAQMRRECEQKQQYAGFEFFIKLSWGNPRHLIILLKHTLSWAAFRNERPFGENPVSIRAQTEGVKEAAEWFFRDARMTGLDGKLVQEAMSRLGTLFRSIRFSHKPSECSLSTFSFEPASVSNETSRLIDLAEKWSFLVDVGGQRDRNSERIDAKHQLARILAPMWDVSTSRRGVLAIQGADLNAIFDPDYTSEFEKRLKLRVDRMTAPSFGKKTKARKGGEDSEEQGSLFGMMDD